MVSPSAPVRSALSIRSTRVRLVALVGAPALFALLLGLTHPLDLDASTADYWRNLHIVMLPVFPLIGAAPWLIARGGSAGRPVRLLAALGGYTFATFYTALDVLAGIGGGTLVAAGTPDVTGPVFRIADALAAVGVVGLVIGAVAATIAAVQTVGYRAAPGGLLAAVGSALILPGHIWFPVGSLALALFIAGYAVLALSLTRGRPAATTAL